MFYFEEKQESTELKIFSLDPSIDSLLKDYSHFFDEVIFI